MSEWLDQIAWDSHGLVPVIAQDYQTNELLMFAWMNRESLQKTVEIQEAVYYSRSRKRLWHKGEESGHIQKIKEIRMDCDNDVLVIKVEQIGGIACHTDRHDCFFQKLVDNQWITTEAVLKNPDEIYHQKHE